MRSICDLFPILKTIFHEGAVSLSSELIIKLKEAAQAILAHG